MKIDGGASFAEESGQGAESYLELCFQCQSPIELLIAIITYFILHKMSDPRRDDEPEVTGFRVVCCMEAGGRRMSAENLAQ